MKKKNGFTLVELLVVISIIALLLAILVPALSKAREQGKALVCQTNMKGLVVSWMVYAENNNDKICGAFTYNVGNFIQQWGHPWDWVWSPWNAVEDKSDPIGVTKKNCTVEHKLEGIRRGSLYKYNQNFDLYKCPSDKSGHLVSYSIPDCLNGMEEERHGTRWKVLTKLSEVRKPSEKYVFLEENDTRAYNPDSWDGPDSSVSPPKWRDAVALWHRNINNFAFADGHSKKRRWSKYTVDQFNANEGKGEWQPRAEEGIADIKFMVDGWAK